MSHTSTLPSRGAVGPAGSPLPDELAFMQVLWALVHRLDTMSKRMGRDLGVTGPQRLTLRIVGLFPGLSAGDVASILHMHPSTLTGVLKRLARQQLMVRHHAAGDRRRAVLRLTAKGHTVNAARAGTVEAAVTRTLASARGGEVAATIRLLERLSDHLDRQPGAAPARRPTRRQTAPIDPDARRGRRPAPRTAGT